MTNTSRYFWSLLASLLFFGAMNVAQRGLHPCNDCARPYGFPFTNWISEGSVEAPRYVQRGLFADFVVAIFVGFAIGALWNWRAARRVK